MTAGLTRDETCPRKRRSAPPKAARADENVRCENKAAAAGSAKAAFE
jgi:hypothetical protein